MKPIPDSWNIVLAGIWNVPILSPEWVGKYLLKDQPLKVEVPVAGPAFLRITGNNGVRILTSPERVQVSPVDLRDESLVRVEETTRELLSLLPHTPVTGLGVNLLFEESDPTEELQKHFIDADLGKFADLGFSVDSHSLIRNLRQPDGQVLNLKVMSNGRSVRFEFNFHRDVTNAQEAEVGLDGSILKHRKTALELLEGVFGLTTEGDDD